MAITNVPEISGPSFGGVIYGLSLNQGYSSQASKLVLDIVNTDGDYNLPTLNTPATITFGNLKFNGVVWSYNLKESSGEKTLQVTLIDNSVVLDRYHVLLWKRGFLDEYGVDNPITKEFDFSDETTLLPSKSDNGVIFVEQRLGSASVTRQSKSLGRTGRILNNLILVGEEKFANTDCDIPDTHYSFDHLRHTIGAIVQGSFPEDGNFKSSHEGKLREVLSSWANDLGYDYYWDYSTNRIVFFDISKGVSQNLPDLFSDNIISKNISQSMEGTFRQYGIGYTQVPKPNVKTLTRQSSITYLLPESPLPLSYFASTVGGRTYESKRGTWGDDRTEPQFIQTGLIGYSSRELRDAWCAQNGYWSSLGITYGSGMLVKFQEHPYARPNASKKVKLMNFLANNQYQEVISTLKGVDGIKDSDDLPNFDFYFINYSQALADKNFALEQQFVTQFFGQYYRIPEKPGSFFYCSDKFTVEVKISVDPIASKQEDNSEVYAGRHILNRGGSMWPSASETAEQLDLDSIAFDMQLCQPKFIDIANTGLRDLLLSPGKANVYTKSELQSGWLGKVNSILIIPKRSFIKRRLGFEVTDVYSKNNPLEAGWYDVASADSGNGRNNCPQYESAIARGSCASAEDEARRKVNNLNKDAEPNQNSFTSGLMSTNGRAITVKVKSGTATMITPSDGQYQIVSTYDMTVNVISQVDNQQFVWTEGSPGTANDVAEIRIANENVTDPFQDTFQTKRNNIMFRPKDVAVVEQPKTIKYTFAGSPPSDLVLSPKEGLTNLDVSLSSDGFTTSASFSTSTPKPPPMQNIIRSVYSQFNKYSFNSN